MQDIDCLFINIRQYFINLVQQRRYSTNYEYKVLFN